jgi:hypothetical protein
MLLLSIVLLFSLIIRGTARKQQEINAKCRYFINDDCAVSYQKTGTGIEYVDFSGKEIELKGKYLITENKNFKGKGK